MRNLKRALSLTLASVMLLGMMVIGTSAASYPDVTEEHNVEAIEVLQAVGVMSGSDSGNFNPDSNVNRLEMAVVMSNLLSLKVDYFEGQCKFTDVPEWAGKYVAACEANGIVSGIGNNQYGIGNVTATQAALMMLKALGYFQYAQDFQGGWEQETAKLASNLSLFKGLDVANTTPLTRNQVAQLALNTLKSPVVQADKSGSDIVIGSGDTAVTITGQSKYVVTASSEPYARAIKQNQADDHTITGEAGYIIELGEKLYNGQLKLNDDAVDEFGRPANYWEYNAKKMGTYVKRDLIQAEYTEEVTGKMLFTELGRDLVNDIDTQTKAGKFDYTLSIYIDGEAVLLDNKTTTSTELLKDVAFDISDITNSNTDGVGGTGNGVLTQVFVDSQYGRESGSGKGVIISIMNTYLAIANKDYDSKKDEVEVEVYKIDDRDPSSSKYVYAKTGYSSTEKKFFTEDIKVSGDRFDIEDVKKDDKFLVTVAEGEIQSMVTPEIASEVTLNSFKRNDWVKNDDVQYDYASTAQYDDDVLDIYDNINMKDVTYNVILDQYGYLIGIELNEAIAQYVFMTGIDLGTSNLSRKNADANVIFTDGTMKTVTVNTDKSELASSPKKEDGTSEAYTITGGGDKLDKMFGNGTANFSQVNRWFTYTVDADGVYTVKEVGNNSQARENGYRTAKKIAQSFIDADTYSNDKFDVNGKNRSLDGSKVKTPAGDFNKVYGNADSIYINAKLTDINDKNSNAKLIVEKVDSVTTGIDNVDFTVENITDANNPGDEAYVLYNNDGYIIAAVILNAEDNGTSAKYAYVTSGIKQEDYLGSNTWRWGVDAIIDGEKVRLTEVNDSQEYIKEGMQGKWYDVRFDKDGNVSSIKANDNTTTKPAPINFTYVDPATGKNDKYITNVHNVARATNGVNGDGKDGTLVTDDAGIYHDEKFEDFTEKLSSLLLYQDFRCNSHATGSGVGTQGTAKLTYKNMTLYTDTKATAGLGISPSTKIIVILSKSHNDGLYDTISDTFTGDSGMKDALKMLDSNEKAFDGWLGAVIKDGIATSIILHDQAGDKDKQGTTPIVPDEKPGVETTLSVVSGTDGVSFTTSNVSAYNKDDEALRGSAIRGGVRYNVKTAEDITIDLPKLNANQKYHVVAAPAANVTGLPANGDLEGETLNIKLANGAATLTVTVVTEEDPAAEVPENAQAAITGVDEGASSGVIKVVYQKTAARAAGSGPDGKPTLEEAVAVVEDHLTRELGYTFTKASSSGTTTYTLKDKFGYPAGTATWAENGSNVIEGARYQDAAKGYETISAADGGVAVTTGKYALVNGTTWTAVGDGNVKVAIGNTDTVKIEEFDGWVKIDGVQTGVNKTYGGSSNAMPSVKDLKVSGTGSGVAKTTAGTTTYVAYNDTTALAQGDELATGYVELADSASAALTFDSTTAGSNKTFAKVGEEVTVGGVTNGNSYRVSVEGGDAIDVTASGASFKIPADKVTGDITVSDLIAHTLTKAITDGDTGMTATWYVNGDEVDFGANATKVVNLSATDKLTVKVTFADKIDKVNSASVGAKLTIKAGNAAVSTAKWTGVGLGEATVASGVIEFEKTADIAAGTAVTGEASVQASAATMTVEYTASN